MRRIKICFMCLVFSVININLVYATTVSENLSINAESAILIEQTTGKVLYEKEADKKLYPASMTKILTALVALEYLKIGESVVIGKEIFDVPSDSSRAWHKEGETITVENLIRGLIIMSGNETACVIAKAVVEKAKGTTVTDSVEAEKVFCQMMNDKAKALGATHSNFINPHGYHNENHYTTARDMAIISREAMKNSLIKQVAAEKEFKGRGAGENASNVLTQVYDWPTHNELIVKDNANYYEYATGIKTGFTDQAGDCVAASATKSNRNLIAIVMNSKDPGRWADAKTLFEYGFASFGDVYIQEKGKVLATEKVANSVLGEDNELKLETDVDFINYMSKDEYARVEREISLNKEFIAPEEMVLTSGTMLLAPIATGAAVGTIKYTLDGNQIFEGKLLATKEFKERTFETDLKYHFDDFINNLFTFKSLLYLIGGFLAIFTVVRGTAELLRMRRRKARSKYKMKKRY